ncbi:sensor histidine kinase [Oceanospirillum maris]|uniref:sensor histidine kinase n=1 Tax=Oceanospirillum maris TaxID=64977 RepID=UPI0004037C78|nr:ATP-binding protein [Oceanospirillum maris]
MSASAKELQAAFLEFSALSEQLTSSYDQLQFKITSLTTELEEAKRQRSEELTKKQQVAEKLEHLLFLLPVGVVVIDGSGTVTSANPTACELLSGSLIGDTWVEVIENCFAPRQGDGYEISLKDGRLVSISTRSLEKEPGQMIVINDMTETRRLQEQVSRSERLTEMGRMVASLAHQIRTPLSAAMLYAGHLQAGGLSEEKQTKFSSKLLGRLKNLEQQIGDMLIFARGGSTIAEPFAIQSLAQSITSETESVQLASNVIITLDVQCDGMLLGHLESLSGAVLNLVNNAVQAGAKCVDITFFQESHELLIINVKDDGPGIAEEQIAKITEPFFTTKSQGTGLGLSIVQSVVSAHKGLLSVESELGKGSQFVISLPVISFSYPL